MVGLGEKKRGTYKIADGGVTSDNSCLKYHWIGH